MTLLAILQTAGILLSGIAAVVGVYNRRHIKQLRSEVNGQTHLLVATTHALGVAEGVAQQQADDAATPQETAK